MRETQKASFRQHIDELARRTSAALSACEFDELVVAAGQIQYRFLDDREVPFVANPQFKWWAPVVDNPGCLLHFRPGEGPVLYYSIPEDYWYKPAAAPTGDWVEALDIRVFSDRSKVESGLPKGEGVAFIGNRSDVSLAERQGWKINPESVINQLHWSRAAKTPYEIECLRGANERAVKGHHAARDCWLAGGSEFDIHLAYLAATAHTDDDLPYHSIVATGSNGSVLHYQHRRRERGSEDDKALLIDAGASDRGYASDITRTCCSGSPLFEAMVNALDVGQQQLAEGVTPGTHYPDLHRQAHALVAQVLCDLELLKVDTQQALNDGLTQAFFPHGVGHYLGLQVHDVGGHQAAPEGGRNAPPDDHPFLRLTRTLEEGHVVTIEPGIYFIPMLLDPLRESQSESIDWKRVDELIPYGGVRIEDNVVASEQGAVNLTREAFASFARE